jgi:DNA-binding response OmpR family regulator
MSEPQRTVLLVEDDKPIQRVFAEALTAAGFTVLAEHDGDWALRTFQNRAVDAVVLDAVLPGRTGFQVAEELRKLPRGEKVPLIFLSGVYRASRSLAELKSRVGEVEFLEKPLEPTKLVDAVFRALGVKRPDHQEEARTRLERARAATHLREFSSVADLEEQRSVESDSQARFRGAMLVRGNLRETAFAEVLAQLHRWRATGALLLRKEPIKKLVYLREGAPNYVRSNLLNETLGHVLVRERMITQEECEESVRRMTAAKRQQGTTLIEMGCISPANLAFALQLQLELKLFDLFTWPEGEYQFNPRAEAPPAQVAIELTPARILFDGIRQHYDEARVKKSLGREIERATVRLSDDPLDRFQHMGLENDEAHLYSLIDGRRTVGELLATTSLRPEDAWRLIFALRCSGMIAFGPPPESSTLAGLPPPPPGDVSGPWPRQAVDVAELPFPPRSSQPPPIERLPERAVPERELQLRQSVERLAARAQDLRRATLFEVLGLPPGAPLADVRLAFAALAKENHPDRLGSDTTQEARAFSEEIFAQLLHAYEVLSDSRRRAEYEAQLSLGTHASDGDEVARILAAEERFREGEVLMRHREYARAQRAFSEATRLYPDEAEFWAWLGWSAWCAQPPSAEAEALVGEHLDRALQLNPRIDRAYVFRGYVHAALGRRPQAEAEFEKALLCNPACSEALHELRLVRMDGA